MKGDFHARFCERRRVGFPPPTHLVGVAHAANRRCQALQEQCLSEVEGGVLGACVAMVDRPGTQRAALAAPVGDGLADRRLDEGGVRACRALPAGDQPGVGVDDECGVAEPAAGQGHVGEVGHVQQTGCCGMELSVDQVRRPGRRGVGHRGAYRPGPGGAAPPVGAHQPLHRAPGYLDALPVEVRPHLRCPVQALRRPPSLLIGLVVTS